MRKVTHMECNFCKNGPKFYFRIFESDTAVICDQCIESFYKKNEELENEIEENKQTNKRRNEMQKLDSKQLGNSKMIGVRVSNDQLAFIKSKGKHSEFVRELIQKEMEREKNQAG